MLKVGLLIQHHIRLVYLASLFLMAAYAYMSGKQPVPPDPLLDDASAVLVKLQETTVPDIISTVLPTITPVPIQKLTIWVPERLAPLDLQEPYSVLGSQIATFENANPAIEIELRRKRSLENGESGILPALRSTSLVAPGALPDITLLSQDNLESAVRDEVIQPLEGFVNSAVISRIDANTLQMGYVGEALYGLAYVLDMRAAVYDSRVDTPFETSLSFDDLLSHRLTYVFPAGGTSLQQSTFLLQYFAAAGGIPASSDFVVEEQALLEVLQFYERAAEAGLVDARLLDYITTADYLPALRDQTWDAGVVSTIDFGRLRAVVPSLALTGIPTSERQPTSSLSVWMWAMVSADPAKQRLSAQFINYMMDAERQGKYAQSLSALPSQSEARRLFPLAGGDSALIENLLANAQFIPAEIRQLPEVRAMQNALAAVLRGTLSAEVATQQVIEQYGQ